MSNQQLWKDVTREERYFCSFLFHDILNNIKEKRLPFLQRFREPANSKDKYLGINNKVCIVDVGYEVCLFRDGSRNEGSPAMIKPFKEIIVENGDQIKTILSVMEKDDPEFDHSKYPLSNLNLSKQTFDIVLWLSDRSLVIVEAKAQQGYTNKQIDLMKIAKAIILVGMNQEYRVHKVHLVALAAGNYLERCRVKKRFDAIISWADVAAQYLPNSFVYHRADSLYGK